MRQYETFELRFQGKEPEDKWAGIELEAVFTREGESKTVRGFYDGAGQYVVRFLPEEAGEYAWNVTGAVCAEGKENCLPAGAAHGPVKAVGTHFEYADGNLFRNSSNVFADE